MAGVVDGHEGLRHGLALGRAGNLFYTSNRTILMSSSRQIVWSLPRECSAKVGMNHDCWRSWPTKDCEALWLGSRAQGQWQLQAQASAEPTSTGPMPTFTKIFRIAACLLDQGSCKINGPHHGTLVLTATQYGEPRPGGSATAKAPPRRAKRRKWNGEPWLQEGLWQA